MSNEYVNASAQFLKESWYRENAGTPEIQEAKLLDEIFEEIVDYCLECDIELDDSVEIANRVIEENLVEEFYEEFLIEAPVLAQLRGYTGTIENGRFTRRPWNPQEVQRYFKTTPGRSTPGRSNPFSPVVPTGRKDPFAPLEPSNTGNRPSAPTRTNQPLWGQGSRITPTSPTRPTRSTRPTAPTTPRAPKVEPTAPPVPRSTMARLGQGERDSIFNREGGRQEYERRMIQAIRSGRRYQPAASTGTPTMNAPRTLGGGVSA